MTRVGNVSVRVHDLNPGCPINETETQMYDPLENGGGDRCNVPITLYRTRECPPVKAPVTSPGTMVPFSTRITVTDEATQLSITYAVSGTTQLLNASYKFSELPPVSGPDGGWFACGSAPPAQPGGETGRIQIRGMAKAEANGASSAGVDLFVKLATQAGLKLEGTLEVNELVDLQPVPGLDQRIVGYLELAKATIRMDQQPLHPCALPRVHDLVPYCPRGRLLSQQGDARREVRDPAAASRYPESRFV